MKMRLVIGGFVLGAVSALVTSHAVSQDSGNAWQEPSPQEMAEMMKAWEATINPGAEHERLEYFAGEWETTLRMWMGGPDAPPMESVGRATIEKVLGGRYYRQKSTGSMMGRPMNGIGYTGYDKFKKRYTSVWIDDHSTAVYTSEGTVDMAGKVFTYFGTMDEPMTGEHDKMVKYVSRIVDENMFVFEVHDLAIVPGETRVVEVVYKRVGSAAAAGN
jgi:hypothetical protein